MIILGAGLSFIITNDSQGFLFLFLSSIFDGMLAL